MGQTWFDFKFTKIIFSSKQKNFFFNITYWRNFHAVVWNFYNKEEKYLHWKMLKSRENVEVDKKKVPR